MTLLTVVLEVLDALDALEALDRRQSTLDTTAERRASAAVEQPQAAAFGSTKVRPDCVGVSAKSTVTPSSSRRLSAGRNRRRAVHRQLGIGTALRRGLDTELRREARAAARG